MPNLFQKRAAAALRQNSTAMGGEKGMRLGILAAESTGKMPSCWDGEHEKRRRHDDDELDEARIDGSGLNNDSEDADTLRMADEKTDGTGAPAAGGGGGNASIANSSLTGGEELKGRKKGLPAKNLMAERRRKKLNDRLYMLRSVVPKISKRGPCYITWPCVVTMDECESTFMFFFCSLGALYDLGWSFLSFSW